MQISGAMFPRALLLVLATSGAPTVTSRSLLQSTLTVPTSESGLAAESGCSTVMAGCTGDFVTLQHQVSGSVTVIDDCTFRVQGWEFDGIGPKVEWWADKQEGNPQDFPYSDNAQLISELGEPGNYVTGASHGGSGDILVTLGTSADGSQALLSPDLNHISVWCEEFSVDFGNAALMCNAAAPGSAPSSETSGSTLTGMRNPGKAYVVALGLAAGVAAALLC